MIMEACLTEGKLSNTPLEQNINLTSIEYDRLFGVNTGEKLIDNI